MARAALIGGAYEARSKIANAQRCVNLYPELNPPDAPYPTTHYPTPGTVLHSSPPTAGAGRGIYRATTEELFGVVDQTLYSISAAGIWTARGTIASGAKLTSMVDNGATLLLTDGTPSGGWTLGLADYVFGTYTEAAFLGATHVDFADGRFIFNQPNTRNFYVGNVNSLTLNALNIAAKIGRADLLVTQAVLRRDIWLLGQLTTEVWYNAGAADFPYAIIPGAFSEHGCLAPYSVAITDVALLWLARDKEGFAIVVKGHNYQLERISTHAMEKEIQAYGRVDDAEGYVHQTGGHVFYVLTFPTASRTWVYDFATGWWHERAWIDTDGRLLRHRPRSHAAAYGRNFVQDYATGDLLYYDPAVFTDQGTKLPRIRSFPHLKAENKKVHYKYLDAEFEAGKIAGRLKGNPVQVGLRWSDDGGESYGNPVLQPIGATGERLSVPRWARLGMGRDRVFELEWSDDAKTALNGASLDPGATSS